MCIAGLEDRESFSASLRANIKKDKVMPKINLKQVNLYQAALADPFREAVNSIISFYQRIMSKNNPKESNLYEETLAGTLKEAVNSVIYCYQNEGNIVRDHQRIREGWGRYNDDDLVDWEHCVYFLAAVGVFITKTTPLDIIEYPDEYSEKPDVMKFLDTICLTMSNDGGARTFLIFTTHGRNGSEWQFKGDFGKAVLNVKRVCNLAEFAGVDVNLAYKAFRGLEEHLKERIKDHLEAS